MDPTLRFSARVDTYARYRPDYPAAVAALAQRECGMRPGHVVADIGCGTGLLARLWLERGCEVIGVEPNRDMREAGQRALTGEPRFRAVDGRAESTCLAAASVDFVTAGQAAHWFEPDAAHAEFARILKGGGWLLLVWNERKRQPGFMREYETLIVEYAPEQPRVEPRRIARFFGNDEWRMMRFDHFQTLDCEGLRGRLASSSYAPLPGTEAFAALTARLDGVFARYQRDGAVAIEYDTEVYYGRVGK